MKGILRFITFLVITGCGSTQYFYSDNKDYAFIDYNSNGIKSGFECKVITYGKPIIIINRYVTGNIGYKTAFVPDVDSLRRIDSLRFYPIMPTNGDTLKLDTIRNTLSFGEKPRNTYFLPDPMPKQLKINVVYFMDSVHKSFQRNWSIILTLRKKHIAGKGLGGC